MASDPAPNPELASVTGAAEELMTASSVAIQELRASAPFCGTSASGDILRAAAELQAAMTKFREDLAVHVPQMAANLSQATANFSKAVKTLQWGLCKDCPGTHSLMCCQRSSTLEVTEADRNLREWILRRRRDLPVYADVLDRLLAAHRTAGNKPQT